MEESPSEIQVKECSPLKLEIQADSGHLLESKGENSVRLLVQEEGRAARNLIAFSVPCDMVQVDSSKVARKPPSSPRTVQEPKKEDALPRLTKRASDTTNPGSRVRSASTGRDKKSELQARYWAFLFGNLQRAVDEIYQTCETDESVSECKEVILVLENFTKDFHNLIEWFRLKWEYEKTPPPQRPNSLAWEVRKSSPGKLPPHALPTFCSPVRRVLNFGDSNDKDRPRSSAEKITDTLRTGKCSPIIPVVEDQEIITFDTEPNDSVEIKESNVSSKDVGSASSNQCFSNPIDTKKDDLPIKTVEPKLESSHDLRNEMKPKIGRSSPDVMAVNEILVSNGDCKSPMTSEQVDLHLPGMTHQACQTDPELDDFSSTDQYPNPLMVDKGVGTSGLATAKTGLATRPSATTAGRVSSNPPTTNANRTPASPFTFAGVATKSASTNLRNSISATVKNTNATSKPVPTLSNSTAKIPQNSNGPTGTVLNASTSSVKIVNTVPAAAKGPAPTSVSNTPKPSLFAIVTKSSPANAIKRNVKPNPQVLPTENRNQASSRFSGPPKLQRSRTVAEVSRSNRPPNNRSGGSRQFNNMNDKGVYGKGASSVEMGAGTYEKPKNIDSSNLQDGCKKNESGDDSGWETVKNRSRCRFSYNPKTRFNKPTCAMSLPALIIVDDDDDDADTPSAKGALTKQNSQGDGPHRRHSEKLEPTSKSADACKVKKPQKQKPSGDVSKPTRVKVEKTANNVSKHSFGKKAAKDVKEDKIGPSSGPCLQETKTSIKGDVNENVKKERSNGPEIEKLWKSCNGNKPVELDLDPQLSGDESSVGPRTSSTTTPTTMTPTTTPATPTTPTNLASDSLAFLRDNECGIERLISDEEDLIAERTLLKEEERKSQQLYEEEVKLQQQIDELQSGELEVEVETDGETPIGTEEEEEEELLGEDEPRDVDVEVDTVSLEAQYENMLEDRIWQERLERIVKYEEMSARGLSWAERMDTLEQLEALVARHPGRALQLHQKLSSPSRSRSTTLPETLRRFQARQEKAQQKRERLLQLKSQRLRDLLNKVGEVKAAQAQLTEDRRLRLENKLKRAEENRNLHLRSIKRKAHDEEEKLKEIAFINELEAQNKRHDFLALRQEQEERLLGIAEERQRKQEEKAAKEAAVEERKRVLEAERIQKLEEMQARRKRRVERIHREQLEKEKERQEAAREKARDREERLSALHAAQLANQEELQKKIQQKQEDSARRHEENIEHIRQRALESAALRYADDAAPALEPYRSKKLCTLCNVLIGSEVYLLSHLRGKSHQEALRKSSASRANPATVSPREDLDHITEAPPDCVDEKQERHRERQRALRKRGKKLRLRMTARGQEFENMLEKVSGKVTSPNSSRIQKCLRDVEKLHNSQGLGQWSNNAVTLLERALSEMNRILDKMDKTDQMAFRLLNGFTILSNILSLGLNVPEGMPSYLPSKCFVTACCTLNLACQDYPPNAEFVLMSNRILTILDLLMSRLTEVVPDEDDAPQTKSCTKLPTDPIAVALMRLLTQLLDLVTDGPVAARVRDVVSSAVCSGAVDRLALVCSGVRDPLPEGEPCAASSSSGGASSSSSAILAPLCTSPQSSFLLAALSLLSALTRRCGGVGRADPSGLGATLQSTELVGAVSMLYGLLLQQGGAPRAPDTPPPRLAPPTSCIASATIALLVQVAELDLDMLQSILGAEGISLQLRHISAHLLWVCGSQDAVDAGHPKLRDVLHRVIRVLGYFVARNHDNQVVLQSGVQPTVLQQLCQLPFQYFSEPRLSVVLFPTLIACCSDNPENKAILEQELSYDLLEAFQGTPLAEADKLMAVMRSSKGATSSRASSVCSTTAKTAKAGAAGLTTNSEEDDEKKEALQDAAKCEKDSKSPEAGRADAVEAPARRPAAKRHKGAAKAAAKAMQSAAKAEEAAKSVAKAEEAAKSAAKAEEAAKSAANAEEAANSATKTEEAVKSAAKA
ncbi:S phase cyclin A-associated protein in the endoplasmic reticulum [Thrips palmi]|uniref:S phase cyclin A-associated protein in the endoplasmic reticulum n=1 Tax=Thrips palmi TaxID=161013 RepID=A0A6P8ZQN8_THRPL|nr:S phase cyclin A-associated protein in the endoplasmic reticulum [Thrips palmi]XP_034246180.1 S phase cyclin A-associated protein in the endoplasmic reticulum [Thrips palmi]